MGNNKINICLYSHRESVRKTEKSEHDACATLNSMINEISLIPNIVRFLRIYNVKAKCANIDRCENYVNLYIFYRLNSMNLRGDDLMKFSFETTCFMLILILNTSEKTLVSELPTFNCIFLHTTP